MSRDGLMLLPDCFTANDNNTIIHYLCCDGSFMQAWHCTTEFLLCFTVLFNYFCTSCRIAY